MHPMYVAQRKQAQPETSQATPPGDAHPKHWTVTGVIGAVLGIVLAHILLAAVASLIR